MSPHTDRAAWLQGPNGVCHHHEAPPPSRPWRMVLLGAPGIGKGTQAELLCQTLDTCHLSTGDVFRAAKCAGDQLSPAMQASLECMKRGELVPDDVVIDMVRERAGCLSCEYGFLLDGFPRTVHQAEALDEMLAKLRIPLDAVLSFELPVDQIVERLSGRRTCAGCRTTYHVKGKPPKVEGVCDACGGQLYQREDDQPESIRVRLKAYEESTAPLKDYYASKGLLITISADGTPQQVFERTMASLKIEAKA